VERRINTWRDSVCRPRELGGRTLSSRLNALLNWLISLTITNSPTMGSLVLIIAMRAEKTGVKGKEDAWAFMIARANRPRPRMRFSLNISGTTYLMLATLT
jgi:hypothetical protein